MGMNFAGWVISDFPDPAFKKAGRIELPHPDLFARQGIFYNLKISTRMV